MVFFRNENEGSIRVYSKSSPENPSGSQRDNYELTMQKAEIIGDMRRAFPLATFVINWLAAVTFVETRIVLAEDKRGRNS